MSANGPRIIVALDTSSPDAARRLGKALDPALCRVKVGKELFVSAGPRLVEELTADGFEVFLDLKFHDIPHTVAQACKAAAGLGVWMVNVHALGGRAMMRAAREGLEGTAARPRLIAVTVLTSLAESDLRELGIGGGPDAAAERLALLAQECGLDGVVCSPREAALLRRRCGPGFCLVTPGVRPAGAAPDDQSRVMTPQQAIAAGSDFLVIGRPITRAPDPLRALRDIHDEIHMQGSASP